MHRGQRPRFLLSVLLAGALLFFTGCAPGGGGTDVPDGGGAGGQPEAVPFLVAPHQWDQPASDVYLGSWDLDEGRVSFGQAPLFTFDGRPGRLHWDGGRRIAVSPDLRDQEVLVENVHSDYEILVLEREISFMDLVKCPSTGDNLIMVSGAFGEQPKMEIRSPADLQEVPLNLDLKPGWEYLRPVAVDTDDQSRISLYVETSGLSPGTGNSLGLAVGDFDGRDMRWRTVSEDLEISEAGGGTQMARWGGRIVIAEQHAEVKALDLETGRLSPLHEVNAHLRDFARGNVKAQEFCVAPTLYTGNDLLIVSWTPAAIEEDPSGGPFRWIPMTCILACSADGRIVGEIRAVEGSLTVIKDGKVTQELDVPEDRFPSCWRFPRE